jgi:hypothetical protein
VTVADRMFQLENFRTDFDETKQAYENDAIEVTPDSYDTSTNTVSAVNLETNSDHAIDILINRKNTDQSQWPCRWNPIRGINVCLRACVGSDLPVQEVLTSVYQIRISE